VWFFTRRHPYAPDITFSDHDPATAGAYHTGDVPYWLGTLDALNLFRRTRDWGAADVELSEAMQSALVSFISRGSPGHEWPAFDPSSPTVMHLGDHRGQIPWPNHDAFDALGPGPGRPAAVPDGATPTPPRD
jgi:para-nitrobenzyl esterase